MSRLLTLILGPIAIVGLAYFTARPEVGPDTPAATAADPLVAGRSPRSELVEGGDPLQPKLVAACQRTREDLMRRFGSQFASIVHTPFVIIGDLTAGQLERMYRETIAPTTHALQIAYFDRAPDAPVTIILLSGDEAYQRCAYALEGRRRAAYAGYYERNEHRVVVNIDTGEGTLAHELTHALGHFDFPQMPEWFDEGLASLFEEARFSDDRLRITGRANWRSRDLLPAIKAGTLRPLESLIREGRVRSDRQDLDYAHARYFCLFLQQRGLIEPFYRKFRLAVSGDPTGLRTLRGLFGVSDLASLDKEFRAWAVAFDPRPSGAADTEDK